MPYAWAGLATPAPWLGFYPGYFTPYATYASPDLWLTDYLIGQNLKLAYENQLASNADQPAPSNVAPADSGLTPEVKALIENEIRQQIADEKAAAVAKSSPANGKQAAPVNDQAPPALRQKFFVVSTNLDLTTTNGQACSLTPGDMIQRRGSDVAADGGIAVEVIKSKSGACPADTAATVQLADLQEMSNQFREQLDSGLAILAACGASLDS
jgi:hypothetical protein